MNFRLTAILFVTIAILGSILLILSFNGDKQTSSDVLLEELTPITREQVDVVELERGDGSKLTIRRVGKDRWEEEWEIAVPGGKRAAKAKADPLEVGDLIGALLKAKPTASSELTTNPALHGLQPPTLRVTLRQDNERSGTINFGKLTMNGKTVFVTTSSRPNRPMATQRAGIEPLFRTTGGGEENAVDLVKWAADFRSKSIFPANVRGAGMDVAELSMSVHGKTLKLQKDKSSGTWTFVTPAGWGAVDPSGDPTAQPGTFTGAGPLLGALTSMQALSPADFVENPSPDELVKDGLNPGNPNTVRVEMKNADGETAVVFIGNKDAAPAPPNPQGMPATGKVWVRIEGQTGIIAASGADLNGLRAIIEKPEPLRDKTLVNADKIDGIDVVLGSQTAKLRLSGGTWKLYGQPTPKEPQAANALEVKSMLDVLLARRTITGFPSANPAPPAKTESKKDESKKVEIKLWSGLEPPKDPNAEPKETGQPTILVFSEPVKKKEGDSISVRRTLPNGTVAEFLLPDKIAVPGNQTPLDLIATIAKTRLELLDPHLKSFSPQIAEKFTVTGAGSYELTRDKQKDPSLRVDRWTFVTPPDQKGKKADVNKMAELLRILGTLSASRFVEEVPAPEKLVEYGLDPKTPRLKVVVGLGASDPADKERVYEFGKETPDPNFVYARQGGRAAVFTVPRSIFSKLASHAELRDHAIFQFDPDQITGVELRWPGDPISTGLNFEKNKDGNWTLTAGKDPKIVWLNAAQFNFDPNKVKEFVQLLHRTSVKDFLPGTPTKEQGFGKVGSFSVVLKPSTGPSITLDVGASRNDDREYYGQTSLLPPTAPTVTLNAAPLKPFKESYKAFARP